MGRSSQVVNGHTIGNWKYGLVKRMKHRAEKFQRSALNEEERAAWGKVIEWFDSIMDGRDGYRRFVNERGAISLEEEE